MSGKVLACLLLAGLLLTGGCAGARHPAVAEGGDAAWFGVYRGTYREAGERPRRFRLLLFVAPPDRAHLELLPPVGGPMAILDAGDGKVSLAFVRDRVAYAGRFGDGVLEAWLGIPLPLDAFVSATLTGKGVPEGVRIEREGPSGGGLPQSLTVTSGNRRVRIEMRKRRRVGGSRAGALLGRGTPPPGFAIRPLDQLPGDLEPVVAVQGNS